MSAANRMQLARWLLLAVVAVGLIAMHHAPAGQGPDPGSHSDVLIMSGATDSPGPSIDHLAPLPDGHDMGAMLHQCLAVLGQFAFLALLTLVLLAGFARAAAQRRPRPPHATARAPDRARGPGGRSLLASVCVLRL